MHRSDRLIDWGAYRRFKVSWQRRGLSGGAALDGFLVGLPEARADLLCALLSGHTIVARQQRPLAYVGKGVSQRREAWNELSDERWKIMSVATRDSRSASLRGSSG